MAKYETPSPNQLLVAYFKFPSTRLRISISEKQRKKFLIKLIIVLIMQRLFVWKTFIFFFLLFSYLTQP
jgi:hypothetical protein